VKLTGREKFLLLMLLIVAMCVGFYNYVYVPKKAEIEAGAAQVAKLETEHTKLVRWQAEVPQTEARLLVVQGELDGWVAEARAVTNTPQSLVFWQDQSQRYGIRLSSVRLSGSQATLTFTAPSYAQTRSFLMEMEKMLAFEVSKARYSVPTGTTVDGSFDIKLHIGPADPAAGGVPVDRTNPFVR